MERTGPFWDVMEGRKPPPPAAVTLGFTLLEIDPGRGTIRVQFEAKPEFLNPWEWCRVDSSRRCSTTRSARSYSADSEAG